MRKLLKQSFVLNFSIILVHVISVLLISSKIALSAISTKTENLDFSGKCACRLGK